MAKAALEVTNLSVTFRVEGGEIHAVNDVSFSAPEGRVTAVVGESGSGKSAMVGALLGLLPPNASVRGQALFDGVDLLQGNEVSRYRGRVIGSVFQDPLAGLNPSIRVGEQLAETLRRHLRLDRRAARGRAIELLRRVELPDPDGVSRAYPHQLSGGMRQRVLIAIAIACDPRLLMADEPTTALDVTIQAEILSLISRLQRDQGMTTVLISHDLGVVAQMADYVVVMYGGLVVERGIANDVLLRSAHPYTRALLRAVPDVRKRRRDSGWNVEGIPGMVPVFRSRLQACPFVGRCTIEAPVCSGGVPPERPAADGTEQFARCYMMVGAPT